MQTLNADSKELAKFGDLAHRWWDPESEFKPLHQINPLRLDWIDRTCTLRDKRVLDVGCGGGILSESMAACGATVTGIDLSEKALSVARLHLLESGQQVDYRHVPVEILASESPCSFDVVTCMEMLEHVPDPASVVRACSALAAPGGSVYFSTISRNLKAYLLAVIGAEYILGMLPRGTHDYARFLKPSELNGLARQAGLIPVELVGLSYDVMTKKYNLGHNVDVNYLIRTHKPA